MCWRPQQPSGRRGAPAGDEEEEESSSSPTVALMRITKRLSPLEPPVYPLISSLLDVRGQRRIICIPDCVCGVPLSLFTAFTGVSVMRRRTGAPEGFKVQPIRISGESTSGELTHLKEMALFGDQL